MIATNYNQSKKLAEILPLETADMFYRNNGVDVKLIWEHTAQKVTSPCWSFAALFNLCPTINGKQPILTRGKLTRLWYCYYEDEIDTQTYDNPIDACYEMIIKLKEMNFL